MEKRCRTYNNPKNIKSTINNILIPLNSLLSKAINLTLVKTIDHSIQKTKLIHNNDWDGNKVISYHKGIHYN